LHYKRLKSAGGIILQCVAFAVPHYTTCLLLQIFIDVLSGVFLSCRGGYSSCNGSSSPGDGTVGLKQSPGGAEPTDKTPGESIANQRDWVVLVTVLDRICFSLSVTAVIVALVIFLPR